MIIGDTLSPQHIVMLQTGNELIRTGTGCYGKPGGGLFAFICFATNALAVVSSDSGIQSELDLKHNLNIGTFNLMTLKSILIYKPL